MKKLFKLPFRSVRTAPVREVSFHPVLASYHIGDILSTRQQDDPTMLPNSISEDKSLFDVLSLIKNPDRNLFLSALLVTDPANPKRLTGIISERDIIRKGVLLQRNLNTVSVKDVMTRNPKTIDTKGSLDEAVNLLFQGSFRHLPVMSNAEPIGLLGINDMLRELFRVQVLHKYNKAVQQTLSTIPNGPNRERLGVIDQEASVSLALGVMNDKDVGSIIVTDASNRVVGIMSEHDFTYKVALQEKNADAVKVKDVMTKDPITLKGDQSILKGLEMIVKTKHRHIPLLGKEEGLPVHKETGMNVIGMLSSKHIIRYAYQV